MWEEDSLCFLFLRHYVAQFEDSGIVGLIKIVTCGLSNLMSFVSIERPGGCIRLRSTRYQTKLSPGQIRNELLQNFSLNWALAFVLWTAVKASLAECFKLCVSAFMSVYFASRAATCLCTQFSDTLIIRFEMCYLIQYDRRFTNFTFSPFTAFFKIRTT